MNTTRACVSQTAPTRTHVFSSFDRHDCTRKTFERKSRLCCRSSGPDIQQPCQPPQHPSKPLSTSHDRQCSSLSVSRRRAAGAAAVALLSALSAGPAQALKTVGPCMMAFPSMPTGNSLQIGCMCGVRIEMCVCARVCACCIGLPVSRSHCRTGPAWRRLSMACPWASWPYAGLCPSSGCWTLGLLLVRPPMSHDT